jgi:hypothetical protein
MRGGNAVRVNGKAVLWVDFRRHFLLYVLTLGTKNSSKLYARMQHTTHTNRLHPKTYHQHSWRKQFLSSWRSWGASKDTLQAKLSIRLMLQRVRTWKQANVILCRQLILCWSNQSLWAQQVTCHVSGSKEICVGFWWRYLKLSAHFERVGDWRVVLKLLLRK